MVRRTLQTAQLAMGMVLAGASAAAGVTWTHVGTSDFTMGDGTNAETLLRDGNRVKNASMVVDLNQNVFAITNDGENITSDGGVTIFRADGTVVHANVRAAGFPGGLTRLVVAGDGRVYAAQNWVEYNGDWYNYGATGQNILRIHLDGSVEQIWNARANGTGDAAQDKIRGIAVGGDGNVYWVMNGASSHWRPRLMWRYDVFADEVQPSPLHGVDQGWSVTHKLTSFEYVGGDWFIILASAGKSIDAIGWDKPRRLVVNAQGATWGVDGTMAITYDPVNRKLWHGSRGKDNTAIMSRWNGSPANPGLFTATDEDPKNGVESVSVWHANNNDPTIPGNVPNGKYWIEALAINPADGSAWMSWGGDNYPSVKYAEPGTYGPLGAVYRVNATENGPNPDGSGVEGTPRSQTSYVMAVAFGDNGRVYALTCEWSSGAANGRYDLYSADIPAPPTGACCTTDKHNPCVETTESSCIGVFRGDGTTCAENGDDCWRDVCYSPAVDKDGDDDVDSTDFALFQACITGGNTSARISDDPIKCSCFDNSDGRSGGPDGQVTTADDFGPFVLCGSGPGIPTPCD